MNRLWLGDRFSWPPIVYLAALTIYVIAADLLWRFVKLPGNTTIAIAAIAGITWFALVYFAVRRGTRQPR